MKKLITALILVLSISLYAQKPKADYIRWEPMTTIDRDALSPSSNDRWEIYNTTTNQKEIWNGSSWEPISSSSGGDDSLEVVIINASTITLSAADIENWKQFFIDETQTDVTITIPQITWNSLLYLNIYHEGTGTVTIQGDTGVTFSTQAFTQKHITLYSNAVDTWYFLDTSTPGSVGGSITLTQNQIAYGSASNEVTSDSNFTWDGSENIINGLQSINRNSTGTYTLIKRMYVPDAGDSDYVEFIIGKAESTRNRASLAYYHAGDNNVNNAFKILFHSIGEVFSIDTQGDLTVTGTITSNGSTVTTEADDLSVALENTALSGTVDFDLDTFTTYEGTLTGNLTITVSNTPALGETTVKNLFLTSTSNETLTLPAGWNVYGSYVADGTRNTLTINFSNVASGLKVDCFINQPN